MGGNGGCALFGIGGGAPPCMGIGIRGGTGGGVGTCLGLFIPICGGIMGTLGNGIPPSI